MLITGSRNGVSWPPIGGVIDLPEDEAMQMVANRYASVVPVATIAPESEIEEALIIRTMETATKAKAKRKRD